MKSKWEKIKELYNNKYTKPLLFFGFYFIFFSFLFMFFRNEPNVDDINTINNDMWNYITDNYEYHYEVKLNAGDNVVLEGKKYNHKNMFIKKINGTVVDEVYVFYDNIKLKKDNNWILTDDFIYVNESFNNNFINIYYLKNIIADSEFINTITNFDESVSDFYNYGALDIEVISVDKVIKVITVEHSDFTLIMRYKNINKVQDFVVEK